MRCCDESSQIMTSSARNDNGARLRTRSRSAFFIAEAHEESGDPRPSHSASPNAMCHVPFTRALNDTKHFRSPLWVVTTLAVTWLFSLTAIDSVTVVDRNTHSANAIAGNIDNTTTHPQTVDLSKITGTSLARTILAAGPTRDVCC